MNGLSLLIAGWVVAQPVASVCLQAGVEAQVPKRPIRASSRESMVEQYCISCHSARLRTAGLSLEHLDASNVAAPGEAWEKALSRLHGRDMPPAGMRWARVGVQTAGQAGRAADAVYTDEQADRGREAYRKHCVRCHLADLGGDQLAPPLVGEAFLSHWKGGTVGALFVKIKESMPPDAPGEPSDAEYAAIITYLLKMNRFPSGQKELTSDVTLLNGIAFP
jgi:mono/diheme cytochrome c family protein